MSGSSRSAAIRLATDDVANAKERLEALGPIGNAALRRIASAGQAAANAFAGVNQALAGDRLRDRAADIAAYGAEMDRLRVKFDPVFAASKRYEAALAEIARAEQVGAINASLAAQARARLNSEFSASAAPLQRATQAAAAAAAPVAALGRTTDATTQNMRALAVQMPDVVQGILTGQSAFTILVQQGSQVVQVTGGMRNALSTVVSYLGGPYIAATAAGAAALAAMAARSADLAGEQRQLDIALRGVGKAGEISAAGLSEYVRELERAGAARDEARKIVADLARTPGLSGQDIGRAAGLAPDLAAALGIDTADAAKRFAEALSGGYDAIVKLDDALNALTADQRAAIRTMLEHGEKTKAVDLAFGAFAGQVKGLHKDALSPMGEALRGLDTSWTAFADAIAKSAPVIAAVRLLNEAVQGLAMMTGLAGGAPPAMAGDAQEDEIARLFARREALRRRYEQVSGDPASSPRRAQIPALEAEIGRLGQQIEALRTQRDQLRGAPEPGATGVSGEGTAASAAARQPPSEQARQQKVVDDLTQSYRDQQRVLAASVPERGRVIAQLQAEREAREKGITGAARDELIRRRVAEATAKEGDAAAQHQAAIEREAGGHMALALAAEQGRAAMLRASAQADALAQAATEAGVDVAGLTEALVDQAAAQEAAKGAEVILGLREQIDATQRLIAAEDRGPREAYHARLAERIRETTRQMEAARDATTDPEIKAALSAQIERIRELAEEQDRQNRLLALKQEITTDRQTMEVLEAELRLVGSSADERERELAALKAMQEIERGGGDRNNLTAAERAFVDGKTRLAEMNSELRRQQSLFQELGGIGERAMDRIGSAAVEALMAGEARAINLGNVLRSVAASAAVDFAKLAVVNPIANSLFGGSRASLFGSTSLSGTGGIGDLLGIGQLFGGESIGSMLGLSGAGGLLGASVIPGLGSATSSALGAMGGAFGPATEAAVMSQAGIFAGSGATLGSLLGGAGAGFGAGMLLNGLLGGNQTSGMIGSGGGALAGAVIGSIVPGIGTLLGGLIGGAAGGGLGGLIGPGESVRGYGYGLGAAPDGLLSMTSSFYNEEGQAAFQQAAAGIEALNAWMGARGLTVGGAASVGGNRNGPDYSHATAGSFAEGVSQLYYHANDPQLEAALSARGNRFGSVEELQKFVEGFQGIQATIEALTAEPVPAFTAQLDAIAATFDAAIAQAREYGLAEEGLAAARAKAMADLEAQRSEYLRQAGVSLEVRRLRAEGLTMEAELAQQAESARQQLAAAADELDRWAASAEDRARLLVEMEEVQAAERAEIISRYGEQAAQALRQAGGSIRAWLDNLASGSAGGASPTDRLAAARSTFERDRTLAMGGDRDALGRITGSADALLGAGRDMFASGSGFQSIRDGIVSALSGLPVVQSYDAMQTAALEAIQAALEGGTLTTAISPSGNLVTIAGGISLAGVEALLAAMHASMYTIGDSLNRQIFGGTQTAQDVGRVLNQVIVDGTAAAYEVGSGLNRAINTAVAQILLARGDVLTSAANIVSAIAAGAGPTVTAINAGNTIAADASRASTESLAALNRILVDASAAATTGTALSNRLLADQVLATDRVGTAVMTHITLLRGQMAINIADLKAANAAGFAASNTIAVDAAAAATTGTAVTNTLLGQLRGATANDNLLGPLADLNVSLGTIDRSVRDVNASLGAVDRSARDINASLATVNASAQQVGTAVMTHVTLLRGQMAINIADLKAGVVGAVGAGNTIATDAAGATIAALNAGNTIAADAANASTRSLAALNVITVDSNAALVTAVASLATQLAAIERRLASVEAKLDASNTIAATGHQIVATTTRDTLAITNNELARANTTLRQLVA